MVKDAGQGHRNRVPGQQPPLESLQAKQSADLQKVRRALDELGLSIDQRGISEKVSAHAGLTLRATQRTLRIIAGR